MMASSPIGERKRCPSAEPTLPCGQRTASSRLPNTSENFRPIELGSTSIQDEVRALRCGLDSPLWEDATGGDPSARNTAAGGSKGAEALSGLARAFFYVGTRVLLVSHWSVNAEASNSSPARSVV
jgi:hypothetical protein